MLRALAIAVLAVAAAAALLWRSILPPAPLAVPPRGATFERVTVVQPGEGRRADRRIVIEGDRIAALEPASGEDDLAGLYALPGLIDMHVHFPPDTGLRQGEIFSFLFLMHGVTTVRDAGDVDGTSSTPPREGVRAGRFPGPRSFACGPFVDGEPTQWANSIVALDAAAAMAAVERIAAEGWDCIKVYDHLPAESLAAVHAAADRVGLPVIGHVPVATSLAEAHLDDVQHLTGVARKKGDDRPFPAVLDAWRSFGPDDAAAVIEASLRLGIAHTPTFVVLERGIGYRDYPKLAASPDVALLPRYYRDLVWDPEVGMPFVRNQGERDFRLREDAYLAGTELVGEMHRAGVAIHAGTDTQVPYVVPGAALHRELRILSDAAGLGPEAAVAAATTVPGRSLALAGLGRIEPGAPADLVLFRRDPTRDLDALDTIEAVVADGRLYRRPELDAQMQRYREYYASPVFDSVSRFFVRRLLASMFEDEGKEE
ncbi:MAG TPA: amidohydrolase family protein [Myxococcota bacterium]|nr:amidohydrolase family protein [Myxococcota bacterium]